MFEFAIDMFDFAGQPMLLYKPVLERDFGQERFLIEDPTCLIQNGQFEKVDILAGITQFEFILPAACEFKNKFNSNKIKFLTFFFSKLIRYSKK